MNNLLYNIVITCPICKSSFEVTKVKLSALRADKTDTDFFVRYKDLQPICYEVFICEKCGYAEFQNLFDKITNAEIALVKKEVCPKWFLQCNSKEEYQSFAGERDIYKAIESYKHLLINQKARRTKASCQARATIRIAWLYRLINDSQEIIYLKESAKNYLETYQREDFPIGKFDESTCLFMIGECSRRASEYEQALKWYTQVIMLPPDRKNPRIVDMVRDQIDEVKSILKSIEQQKSLESSENTTG
jgi:uncharacterized protein (DUF2225 family)